ncbi:DUF1361 domain-containing protein [Flavobacterium sp.]|uniref:DUF1361 domain-containing protein n=1 Tax=Flavobacterium sp. TaxID=239 RepID=UPI0025F042BC|nr:DUF1361 domain-containing protein [Flavobacterium sp.]
MNKILTIYFLNKKQNSNLVSLGIISIALMLLRVKITHDIYLLFLIWNLFLGYIPYFLSSEIKITVPGRFKFYLLFVSWFLFLPNAFYLLTDFKHLNHDNDLQYLFDTLLLACFSIAGFYAGISSMLQIQGLLEMKFHSKKCRQIIVILCYLSAFGVYLGRVMRFNSWDILSNPVDLFSTILNSTQSFHTYEFTFYFGSFILIIYSISYLLFENKTTIS